MGNKKKSLTSVSPTENEIAITQESMQAGDVEHTPKEKFPILGIGTEIQICLG